MKQPQKYENLIVLPKKKKVNMHHMLEAQLIEAKLEHVVH